MKIVCPVCKGSGKLLVTRQPKAESNGEEMIGECPTCHGKGGCLEFNRHQFYSIVEYY